MKKLRGAFVFIFLMLAAAGPAPAEEADAVPPPEETRDAVGDLNAEAVLAGDFPGSFKIPGPGNVSLAVGGFVKAAVIYDSDAETMGADFLPAILGARRADEKGRSFLDATITRLHLDGRAPIPTGRVRGYVEWDLNAANDGSLGVKMRQAYGTWSTDYGTLTAGQTWSTMMDLKILPEGLTEPTASGVIFARQALVRWSSPAGREFAYHAAIENPASTDVYSPAPVNGYTTFPDAVMGVEYDRGGVWHVRLNGIVRNVAVYEPAGGDDSAIAWGSALSAHWNVFGGDRLVMDGIYGEGLGRYLLGIPPTSGSAFDLANETLTLRANWGGVAAYRHHWSDPLRSTVMFGYAYADPLDPAAGDTFESSTYGAVNLMWSAQPYLTFGVEYGYGQRKNTYVDDLDNHRAAFGVQFF